MSEDFSEVERFYQDVADLLGLPRNYEYNPNTLGGRYRTRWNNRRPGNGRFEGYGLVRYFGPSDIHVAINHPVSLNRLFSSREEALLALRAALDGQRPR